GHPVFATEGEAMAERDEILRIYKTITEEYLALPGLVGKKTDAEKFAGATASYSIEHLMPDGKAIQGPDFHSDGQNFAKAFEITFVDRNGQKQFAWQNTWAISTREIGVMLAIHSDDKGLIVPPRVALFQVVIVPIFDEESRELKEIQKDLYQRALSFLEEHTYTAETFEQLKSSLKNGGIVRAPWCLSPDCEAKVKEETGAKIINLPMDQKGTKSRCVNC